MKLKDLNKLAIAIIISELAGTIGSVFTISEIQSWYTTLQKPALNPPDWIFGPVWTTLFVLIGVSLYLVWKEDWKVKNPLLHSSKKTWNPWSRRLWSGDLQKQNIIAIFGLQYILNILWSYIFFGLHMPNWAFFEILALWSAIVYMVVNFYRVSKPAAYLLLPYLLWVSFATYLNFAIWMLN